MNIILIGSGHVATVLGRVMLKAGHSITGIWSRDPSHARQLSLDLGAAWLPQIPASWPPDVDIIFVSVNDDAYPLLASRFPATEKLIVHSGGAVPGNVFQSVSARTGVLYPLQTVRKETLISSGLPLLIDASSKEDLLLLKSLALSLTDLVSEAGDTVRLKYHLAAVFAANFANHLFSLAEAFCLKESLDFRFLRPLLEETVVRMRTGSPSSLQTGPAVRGDQGTIQKHLLLLENEPEMKAIYACFSKSIMDFYS